MRSFPSRSSRPAVFRAPSRVAVERRLRSRPLRTMTEGPRGVLWTVGIDWDGDGYDNRDDNVTADVLHRSGVVMEYGRDQARALSPMTSGRASAEIDNITRKYSPDNTASPLAGRVLPARPFRIQAYLDGRTYTVFQGHLDDYKVQARIEARSVAVTALDPIAKLRDAEVTTRLHQGVRTGEAIALVLDAIGWPQDLRDLDPGVTLIRWWWEDGADAFEAIERLVASEGPGAVVYADERGRIVFRDRHHRLLRDASTTAQAHFQPGTPLAIEDMDEDQGWRDIINAVTIKVDEYDPGPVEAVWESPDVRTIVEDTTVTLRVNLDNPVINPRAVFRTLTGTVTGTVMQTSGQSLTISLTAGPQTAAIAELAVHAQPVTVQRSYEVERTDPVSIQRNGRRSPMQVNAPWAGVHDADAIAELVLGAHAERRPVATITLSSRTDESSPRLVEQLGRDLSDRVHITEWETCTDHDYFLERIMHRISSGGMLLTTEFGFERAVVQPANVFTFDDPARGFDRGVFGSAGLDDPEHLLIFDRDGHGFDEGVFAT